MPNFTAQDWVTIVQGIGIISVISLILLYLLGWRVWPWFREDYWPVVRARMLHANTQVDRMMEKREADQDKFLAKLDSLEAVRGTQMREQTAALTKAIHDKDAALVTALGEIKRNRRDE